MYLNAGNALDAMLARVAAAGGQVLLPATVIGEQGVIAIIRDSEGNRVGLHAPPVS
jgi:predicted enzyme related to lactoylglutathione lyase